MNGTLRGVKNAFRNVIRTGSIVTILGLSVGLALSMLIAHQAVKTKINSVKSSVGNTVSIAPAGARGFEGGGTALTEAELAKVRKLAHVTALSESLSDRLSTSDTNLTSAVTFGSLGQRFAQNSNTQTNDPNTSSNSRSAGNDAAGAMPNFASRGSEITVLGTTDPTDLSNTQGGGTFKLTSGTVFSATSSANVAVVGKALANKNGLKVGSTFTAYGTTITVIGIYDAGNTFSNNQLLMPLLTVQTLSDQSGDVTSAVATIDSVTNVAGATKQIQNTLGSSTADVTNSAETAQAAVASLQNIQSISLYSLIGAVGAGAVIILLTMIMIVRERRREIGVLKAIGASNLKIMWQFMTEAVTLTLLAAVIGIVLGVIVAKPITNMLVSSSSSGASSSHAASHFGGMPAGNRSMSDNGTAGRRAVDNFGRGASRYVGSSVTSISADVGWSIIGYGLGVGIVIALVGSALASFFIAKVRPAEVMRTE